jgi:SWI/SNF-related matrix-associated actin-dependent regulator of chromatin subfamily A3
MAASSSRGGAAASADDDDEPYLLGFIISKIVGMLYYCGKVAGREPLNQYDNNAIVVFNARNDQVGHLPGVLAAVLAPLLDSHLLVVAQGIMPRSGSKINPNAYSLPCQVHLFARPAAASVVEAALHEAGIDLIHVDHPEFTLSQAGVVMEQFKKPDRDRDVDKLFSLVGKEGKNQTQRMDPPGMLYELFGHQKEALGWMVHREESADLPPFWQEGEDGGFENVLTNQKTEKRPPPLKGGIFADDMGLGKTLTLLSLIGRTKARNVGAKKARGGKLLVCPPTLARSLWSAHPRCSHLGCSHQINVGCFCTFKVRPSEL